MMLSKPMKLGFVIGAVSAILLGGLSQDEVFAEGKNFNPVGGSGDWNYAAHWSPYGVPQAGDQVDIEASGDGWTLECTYINPSFNPLLARLDIGRQGFSGTADARLLQDQDTLHTIDEYLGKNGRGEHIQSGGAVVIDSALNLGLNNNAEGYYELSGGSLETGVVQIGGLGSGEILQTGGTHTVSTSLILGGNALPDPGSGTYTLQDGTLETHATYVGGTGPGTFEQSGGAHSTLPGALILGPAAAEGNSYTMTGGQLDTSYTRLAGSGSLFTLSGGVHTTESHLEIGSADEPAVIPTYNLSGTGELAVSEELRIGHSGPGQYTQTGGTAEITGDVQINAEGEFQMNDGILDAGDIVCEGLFSQDGGVLTTYSFSMPSAFSVTLDYEADFRARYFTHDSGILYMWRNAILRGPSAGAGTYYLCEFTNNASVQMGNATYNGGTFQGILTNHGLFAYGQGDFTASTLINHGTFSCATPFSCNRFIQNAGSYLVSPSAPLTANGLYHLSAVENNATLTIQSAAEINVINAPLVNNGNLYAGGRVNGEVENNGHIHPSPYVSFTGRFYVDGGFTQTPTGELAILLGGTSAVTEYDQVVVTGMTTLGGTLSVSLTGGFTPNLGDSFEIMRCLGGLTGGFDTMTLPPLPGDWFWEVNTTGSRVELTVAEPPVYFGDMDCDNDVDLSDASLFIEALVDPDDFTGCDIDRADINRDRRIDGEDTQGFVDLLLVS